MSSAPPAPRIYRATVAPELGGERLDKAIAHMFPEISRTLARRLIDAGAVRLDGRRVRTASRPVRAGQRLEVGHDQGALNAIEAQPPHDPQRLNVVAEHPGLLVVVKPPGQHTQPTAFGEKATLEDDVRRWLLARLGEQRRGRPYVGIVHRLDAETSGLIVVATHPDTAAALTEALRRREIKRGYDALIEGAPLDPRGTIELPLTKRIQGRVRVSLSGDTKPATTHYAVHAVDPTLGWTHVKFWLDTGRQHQIRVHAAETFGPIVGDALYGTGAHPGRMRLHASWLELQVPSTGERIVCTNTPEPEFFTAVARFR